MHYVNGRNGVKDFDVWSFYAQYDDWPFPARWRGTRDFGPSKFGRYPRDAPRYSGRRVDLLGRSLRVEPGADLTEAIRRYLTVRRTRSAKELAAKAVVLIDPESRLGEIAWSGANHTSERTHMPLVVRLRRSSWRADMCRFTCPDAERAKGLAAGSPGNSQAGTMLIADDRQVRPERRYGLQGAGPQLAGAKPGAEQVGDPGHPAV